MIIIWIRNGNKQMAIWGSTFTLKVIKFNFIQIDSKVNRNWIFDFSFCLEIFIDLVLYLFINQKAFDSCNKLYSAFHETCNSNVKSTGVNVNTDKTRYRKQVDYRLLLISNFINNKIIESNDWN